MVYLVADERERLVIPHLRPLLTDQQLFVKTINTGDYLVCRLEANFDGPPTVKVIACLERKSLKDFSQSLSDGRHENRQKMLELRAKTGCQLYYIIEGPAFKNPESNIGSGRKYKSILSSMTTMPLANGIHVLQTLNVQNTAERLRDIVLALDSISDPYIYPHDPDAPEVVSADAVVPEMVTGSYALDPDTYCMKLWSGLTGITPTTAKMLVEICSVSEFLNGGGPDVSSFRVATGKLLVKKGRDSLKALQDGRNEAGIKVLSQVTGITGPIAKAIFEHLPHQTHKLKMVCSMSVETLQMVQIQQKNRTINLGPKRAEKILKILHWKGEGRGDSEQPIHAAPQADVLAEATGAAGGAARQLAAVDIARYAACTKLPEVRQKCSDAEASAAWDDFLS